MGVMSCYRKNCDNIMCRTYVLSVGYICSECQTEFKEYLEKNNLHPTTEGEIIRELEKFMATSKGSFAEGKQISVDDFFDEHSN